MKSTITKSLFVLYLTFVTILVCGQQDSTDTKKSGLHKNIVYGSCGIGYALFSSIEGSYERMIWENQELIFSTFWARVGFGGYTYVASEVDGGPYIVTSLGTITGSKNNHFEFQLGLNFYFNKSLYNQYLYEYQWEVKYNNLNSTENKEPYKADFFHLRPDVAIGYRFQKPGSLFLFKIGIGYPKAIYVGIGLCF